jgi:DNA-binding transcriptional LysR family regulator
VHDWNDIRFFLAAGRAGSLNGAAKDLRTSHPTVARRLAALEESIGVKLFARHQDGLTLTPAGGALWDRAIAMEEAALSLERGVDAQDDRLTGEVRISATEGLGALWLTPRLLALSAARPGITLDILLDNDAADLMRREADIAIRLARPIAPDLIARRVGELPFRLFAAASYLERCGVPASIDGMADHRLVTLAVRQSTLDATWQAIVDSGAAIACRSNSAVAQLEAVRAGLGVGLLPSYVTALAPDLRIVLPDASWQAREIWLVAHHEVKQSARVRVVFDEIARLFKTEAASLRGAIEADFVI